MPNPQPSNPALRIGVIGAGNMGGPIAARFATTGQLVGVYDADPVATHRAATELSVVGATSAAALAAEVDILVTVLPTSAIVEAVLFYADGAAAALPPGATVIDMTSGLPARTREFSGRLAQGGIAMIDAPVSGGVERARRGELTIMVGGELAALERVRPALDAVGNKVFHVGAIGAGQAMKALNNLVSAGGLLIAAEAVRVAQQFGIASDTVIDVLNASSGMNNATQIKFKPFILSGTYASGFGMGLMVKDLTTALGVAEKLELDVPFSQYCLDLWQQAARDLPKDADHTMIARFVETTGDDR